jgi:hypothetical protein
VDCLLLVVHSALFVTFVWPAVLYIYLNYLFLIILQQKINTVTVEGVENVEEEDCIKIKTEQHYIQLGRTVKSEQEVNILCCVVVCVCVCACGLYCTLYLIVHSFRTCISHFIFCM